VLFRTTFAVVSVMADAVTTQHRRSALRVSSADHATMTMRLLAMSTAASNAGVPRLALDLFIVAAMIVSAHEFAESSYSFRLISLALVSQKIAMMSWVSAAVRSGSRIIASLVAMASSTVRAASHAPLGTLDEAI